MTSTARCGGDGFTSVPVDLFLPRFHRAFLAPYPKTSAGDPGGHDNHQRDPHRRTGGDAGRGGGAPIDSTIHK